MKLTQKTVQILKNFASINQGIHIKKGDSLSTMSQVQSIVAKAKLDQEFEHSFALYDLNKFLGALSLFNDPELKIHEKYLTIQDDNRELNYTFTSPKMIAEPLVVKLPQELSTFDVSAKVLSDVTKALNVMSLPEIAFIGDGENVSIHAVDSSNPTSDTYKVTNLGKTDNVFTAIFKIESMKIIPNDYRLTLTKGVAYYAGSNIEYWVVAERNSKF